MRALCTISDSNYVGQAMVMLKTAKQFNPDIRLFYVCIDELEYKLRDLDFEHISLKQIFGNHQELNYMKEKYDLIEFSTAIKPFLLIYLINLGFHSVMYLDPDIEVFSSLVDGFELAEKCGIALTPHRLTPTGEAISDQLELSFLKFGIFNLGFIAVSSAAFEAMEWWASKTKLYSDKKPFKSQFTDQKWANFFPAYFTYSLIKHPGYNVAPWNIDERKISVSAQGKYVNNLFPLVFIHYSQKSSLVLNGKISEAWNIYEDKHLEETYQRVLSNLICDYNSHLIQIQGQLSAQVTKKNPKGLSYLSVRKTRSFTLEALKTGIQLDNQRVMKKIKKMSFRLINMLKITD